mmetsp:Transcript_41088/g.66152  ORF Transcript_41088/g.66152 Transcript_41088/m.66152 type:complete len:568 (+) Transcript_41088:170-1873(+)|eukprot:CAMPEP_0203745408 /NCGR_PEP_ID=MMETSP0098-20131031/1155_1 /ASSEMBLY_ACC=CAM_ASM_000208 /TAXON_ID=96639 /ORGANISM=" , Strain NY0313808BC1" /LENGTH=567 /DNA_ID=CAMNT_0050633177 /DNA_START=124 /DNA_END=1827 /DNA_ORIENTATION=-
MDISTEGPTEKKTCIVVNEDDETQYIGKLAECHIRPMTLHRAFSLFIFDEEGRLLLQQRAKTKYTFPLAWTNTVCSHPRNEEKPMEEWIDIRVQDELGWKIKDIQTRLRPVGKLTYSAFSDFKYGEKEVDTLYFLQIKNGEKEDLHFNRDEVEAIDWVEPSRLLDMMTNDLKLLTPWFRAIANGFGHPFYNNIRKVYDKHLQSLSQEETQPEECKESAHQTTFVDEKSGLTLPWFRVGDCSMPTATEESHLLLQMPFSYLCSNPGKAIRTELVKLYAEFDSQVTENDVNGISWIVERIHTASLLHDDIEDRSATRRGAVCAHHLWGTAQTINTGTFNFLRAVQGIDEVLAHRSAETRSAAMRSVVNTLIDLHRGQNADIVWGEHALCPTVSDYIDMIDNKTGALFKACAQLGSICSGSEQTGKQISEQFNELGRYFQIRDDFCNICDPVYWKGKGFYEDADEGKYSYPVLVYLEKDTESKEDQEWLRNRLANKEETMTLAEKQRAYSLLFSSNSLEETKKLLQFKLQGLEETIGAHSKRAAKILQILNIVDILTPEQVELWLTDNKA